MIPRTFGAGLALAALTLFLLADLAAGAITSPAGQPDMVEYHAYAQGFMAHHALPQEYPPLAILAFLLTLAPPTPSYLLVFGAWMLVFVAASYWLIATEFGQVRGLAFLAYIVAGAAATVLLRFDMIPALLVLIAFVAMRRKRWLLCYVSLAVATLFKLFPVFLVPLVAIDQLVASASDGGGRVVTGAVVGLAAFSGIVVAGFGGAFLVDPSHGFEVFDFAASRPLELESGPASLLWLLSFTGAHVDAVYSYRSFNLQGVAAGYLAPSASVAAVAGLGYVYIRFWLKRGESGQAWIAALLVTVLTSKVLSAQYMIWIFPLVAAVEGFSATWLVIAGLTTVIFPYLFTLDVLGAGNGRMTVAPPLLSVIAVRNALLVIAFLQTCVFTRKPSAATTPGAAPARAPAEGAHSPRPG